LLELFVDHLADDEAARALAKRLSADAQQNPVVRAKLALAEARAGDAAACERWLVGVDTEDAAHAWLACAARALEAGEIKTAEVYCLRAAKLAPHEGADLRRKVEQARAERLAAAEAELVRLAAGSPENLLASAQAILAEYPESRAARGIIEARAAASRDERARAKLALARGHVSRGELDVAAALLRAELPRLEGGPSEEVAAELAGIETRIAVLRRGAEIERVAALVAADPLRGIAAHLGLAPAERQRVRAMADRPALGFAEQAGASKASPEEVATCALAIEELLEKEEPGAVVARRLEPIAAVARCIPEGRRLLADAHARLADERRRAAVDALAQAEARLAANDGRTARTLATTIDASALNDDDRRRLQRALPFITAAAQLEDWDDDVAAARARGAWLDALEVAVRLRGALPEGTERRAAVERAIEAVRASVDAQYSVTRFEGGYDGWFRRFGERHLDLLTAVREDRDELVLAWPAGRTVCLHRIDLSTGDAVATMVFTVPGEDGGAVDYGCAVRDGRAYLTTQRGAVIVIALDDLRIERRVDPQVLGSTVIEHHLVTYDDDAFVWIHDRTERCRITSLSSGAVVREISGMFMLYPYEHAGRTLVVGTKHVGDRAALYSASGRLIEALDPSLKVEAATSDPRGDGVVLFNYHRDDDGDGGPVSVVACGPGGAVRARCEVDGLDGDAHHRWVTSNEQGAVFLAFGASLDFGTVQLAAFEIGDATIRELWRAPFSAAAMLVGDPLARRAFVVEPEQDRLRIEPLTRSRARPRTPADGVAGAWTNMLLLCNPRRGGRPDSAGVRATLSAVGPAGATDKALELLASRGADADLMTSVVAELDALGPKHAATIERIAARHPTHAPLRVVRADHAAAAGDWLEVSRLLDGIEEVPADLACHLAHLRGVLLATEERFDEAAAALAEVQAVPESRCDVADLLAHLDEIRRGLDETAAASTLVARLVRELVRADRALDAGDFASALNALESTDICAFAELQYLARSARCLLELPARDLPSRTKKRLVLSQFIESHGARGPMRREIILPRRWPRDRLDALVADAQAWLDATRLGTAP
jgi:hypothetical protein